MKCEYLDGLLKMHLTSRFVLPNKEPLACFKEVSIDLEDFVEKIRGYVGETELQIGNVCENGDSFCTSCGF